MSDNKDVNKIVEASEFSFKELGAVRFCLTIDDDKKESVESALTGTSLSRSDFGLLVSAGVIRSFFLDDRVLHVIIRKEYLSTEQIEDAEII